MIRLANAVIYASLRLPVPHPEPEGPAAQYAAKDNKPDPNGFERPSQWGVELSVVKFGSECLPPELSIKPLVINFFLRLGMSR